MLPPRQGGRERGMLMSVPLPPFYSVRDMSIITIITIIISFGIISITVIITTTSSSSNGKGSGSRTRLCEDSA